MEQSPFDEAARQIMLRLKAAVCTIYEHVDQRRLILCGIHGIQQHLTGTASELPTSKEECLKDLDGRRTWIGFTSFAVYSRAPVQVTSRRERLETKLDDGGPVTVEHARKWHGVSEPGPLLAVPVLLENQAIGVLRVVAHHGRDFTAEQVNELSQHAALLSLLFKEAKTRRNLIAKIHQLTPQVSWPFPGDPSKADPLLEGIIAAAGELLRAPEDGVAMYLWDPRTGQYTFRAPHDLFETIERGNKRAYALDAQGLTAEVWKPHDEETDRRIGGPAPRNVLCTDLARDLAEDGPFRHVQHTSGDAETPSQKSRSWVGVFIGSRSAPNGCGGVIRASSPRSYAFSYSDVVMLRTLAEATERLLDQRRTLREKGRPYHALLETIDLGVIAVDEAKRVQEMNPAARSVLGLDAVPEGQPILDLLFDGRLPLAENLERAIEDNGGHDAPLADYYTVFFRRNDDGPVPIPVRLRASRLIDEETGRDGGIILVFRVLREQGDVRTIYTGAAALRAGRRTTDPQVARTFERAREVPSEAAVMIFGETGTGKNLLAMSLHANSRRAGDFVEINCAEIPRDLLQAELFGTRAGAFSGAVDRQGLVETAHGGTVFLNEIAELPQPG